jgi:hypothetical protein
VLAIVLAAALALPAFAGAATATFRGPIADSAGAKIRIETTVRGGKVRWVRAFELLPQGVPVRCDVSGADAVIGRVPGLDAKVGRDRHFSFSADDGDGNTIRFGGRFSANFRKANGTIQLSRHFTEPEDEVCYSDRHRYRAKR